MPMSMQMKPMLKSNTSIKLFSVILKNIKVPLFFKSNFVK
ncbi:hypothetical protein HJ01_00969 [Flavobacterium frigoris PS1]|uniref:Uncharacterized protein n=1 Tax=Flavobacterium frigoris (strain PS1) TaxID=1086011 RepID=H7FP72_FLAFP|nr:hypothetical protein HJ01_00969 [Flavobacterium frigoris PS1]